MNTYKICVDKGFSTERIIYFKDKEHRILHREDGPAVEFVNLPHSMHCYYYLDNVVYSKIEYEKRRRFGDFV